MATTQPPTPIPPPKSATTPPPPTTFPLPPTLQHPSAAPPVLITQGAEGRLYRTTYLTPDLPCAAKYRPPKPYRHPVLDARLTRHRILAEARVLARSRREGVAVPALYAVDEAAGLLVMEWVAGEPVRVRVNGWLAARRERRRRELEEQDLKTEEERGGEQTSVREQEQELEERVPDEAEVAADEEGVEPLLGLLRRIGEAVGRLHRAGIVHGDLTTSNMMLRPWTEGRAPTNGHQNGPTDGVESLDGEIVIIDFGLASQGTADEDRAVDLYVLERAFGSTHPKAERVFPVVLDGYRGAFKGAPVVLKKLEDVRMRGRKRSMLG